DHTTHEAQHPALDRAVVDGRALAEEVQPWAGRQPADEDEGVYPVEVVTGHQVGAGGGQPVQALDPNAEDRSQQQPQEPTSEPEPKGGLHALGFSGPCGSAGPSRWRERTTGWRWRTRPGSRYVA